MGSAILAGFCIAALPFSRGLFRAPRTPYDVSDAQFTVPAWILLQRAEPLIPPDASVVVRVEPPDSNTDSYLHRLGVALVPGRKMVPAARWGVTTAPEVLLVADYEIVVGATTSTPEGGVWRRDR